MNKIAGWCGRLDTTESRRTRSEEVYGKHNRVDVGLTETRAVCETTVSVFPISVVLEKQEIRWVNQIDG